MNAGVFALIIILAMVIGAALYDKFRTPDAIEGDKKVSIRISTTATDQTVEPVALLTESTTSSITNKYQSRPTEHVIHPWFEPEDWEYMGRGYGYANYHAVGATSPADILDHIKRTHPLAEAIDQIKSIEFSEGQLTNFELID